MICKGYKISGYDASYRKCTFKIIERNERVLEITDIDGGTTFVLDLDDIHEQPRRTSKWKPREDAPERHGVTIAFGEKGFYQKLKYGEKKCKMRDKGEAE